MKAPEKISSPSTRHEVQKILELAVSCKFLSAEQENEILLKLAGLPEKNPDKFTAQLLFKEKILPKDKIELLFAVKKHLDVLVQDRMFGKLGVANQFVSQEKVDQALGLQVDIFRKNKKSVKIGDILENIKEISPAEKTAILLTQDRIRDELLAEALNTIATTEMEKIDISRRFGAIAIKMELITPKQLNRALKLQEKEVKEKGTKRFLGEIVKELFGITDKDILKILKTQKVLETKRLNLKKNIEEFQSGKTVFERPALLVTPVDQVVSIREIHSDIIEDMDESGGPFILHVKGNIARGVTVFCHGVRVEGDILGNVTVTGDIMVKGNIGKSLKSAEILSDPVFITAEGIIEVSRHIMNAKVFAAKGVLAPHSDIVSSEVSSFQSIVVKNVLSANAKPSVLKIGRKNFFKIDNINAAVSEKMNALNGLLFKEEREQLTRELMKQIKIQDGYLEKQNALLYLKKILDDPELKSIKDISEKIKAASGKEQYEPIPENTKTREFMEKIIQNINGIEENAQDQYLGDLLENISGVYQAAVIATQKIEKKHEARSKSMEAEMQKSKAEIAGLKKQIEKLQSQKDILLMSREKSQATGEPVIKVKNRVDAGTLIKGEKSEKKIETAIHGVSFKEDRKTAKGGSKIIIEGYFE